MRPLSFLLNASVNEPLMTNFLLSRRVQSLGLNGAAEGRSYLLFLSWPNLLKEETSCFDGCVSSNGKHLSISVPVDRRSRCALALHQPTLPRFYQSHAVLYLRGARPLSAQ